MHDYTLYLWIGVWLFVLPFLGIPGSWKETLLILTALFLVVYSLLRHQTTRDTESAATNGAAVEGIKGNYPKEKTSVTRPDSDRLGP